MKNLNLKHEFKAELIKDMTGQPSLVKGLDDILMPAIAQLPQGGMDFVSMTPRITLIQKIRAAQAAGQDHLLLETADHEEMVRALKAQKFALADVAIFEYVKSVIELPDEKVKVVEQITKKTKGSAA